MNNHVSPESKEGAIKALAIIGFIVVIILAVWLAVAIVRMLPDAFSSLAGIAGSVESNRPTTTLEIESDVRVVNVNDTFTITWNDVKREGTYTIEFACVSNVAIALKNGDREEAVECEREIALPQDM